ncbi:ABC transporter substrate-binding protein [Myxococcota bacterium]|nr:ABC transporter substrate-binding protein [Myxococcota bacterium]MBU1380660.1 ABC transporter substrate-binding protein [Myxococcota bacterium]MBU1495868.1 ABC transporter substrate-binding protein [Myxococcota bacterium]
MKKILLLFILLEISCSLRKGPPKDTAVILVEAEIGEIDPRYAVSAYGVKLSRLIFSSMISYDNEKLDITYELLKSVKSLSDTKWELVLRKGRFFADGSEVTAGDIAGTIELYRSKIGRASPYGHRWKDVEDISVEGKYRVIISLEKVRPTFIQDLDMPILPVKAIKSGNWSENSLFGAGRWKIKSRSRTSIILERNPWYSENAGKIKYLEFRSILEENIRALLMESGYADLSQNNISQLVSSRLKNVIVSNSPGLTLTYIGFNTDTPYLKDVKVRRALAMAVDRNGLIQSRFRNAAIKASSVLPPSHPYSCETGVEPTFNPQKASQILEEAGYTKDSQGVRFTLEYKTSSNPFRLSIVRAIAMQWAAIGVHTRIRSLEWGVFYADVRARRFEVLSLQLPEIMSPDILGEFFHSSKIPSQDNPGGFNRWGLRSTEFDKNYNLSSMTMDSVLRKNYFCKMQKIIQEQLPVFPIWFEHNSAVKSKRLRKYRMIPNARFTGLNQLDFN